MLAFLTILMFHWVDRSLRALSDPFGEGTKGLSTPARRGSSRPVARRTDFMGLELMPASRREPELSATTGPSGSAGIRSRLQRVAVRCLKALGILIVIWFLSAYLILPALWRHYEHHPALAAAPK